jgi:probable phosphoglycerate mutase
MIPPKTIRLYIVRHGETVFNTRYLVQGVIDTPLTDDGVAGAVAAGLNLADTVFVAAYCGDLDRQRCTLRLIFEQNHASTPTPVILDSLREWDFGGFEGHPWREMWEPVFQRFGERYEDLDSFGRVVKKAGYATITKILRENDPRHAVESYDHIIARSRAALDRITQDAQAAGGGNVLIVSSCNEISALLTLLVPKQYQDELVQNCSITIVQRDGDDWTLEQLGSVAHSRDNL